jgi:hypothetical protein
VDVWTPAKKPLFFLVGAADCAFYSEPKNEKLFAKEKKYANKDV